MTMTKTSIEWCDHTINPAVGCTKCSPGCANCYAERMSVRLAANPATAAKYAEVVDKNGWTGLISYDLGVFNKLPKKPSRIFVGSMCDLFFRKIVADHIDDIFKEMAKRPEHTFYLLTKRPGSAQDVLGKYEDPNFEAPENVWLGATVCNQEEADEKIPILLNTNAAHHFVSIEPMLGEINLKLYLSRAAFQCGGCNHMEWDPGYACEKCKELDESGKYDKGIKNKTGFEEYCPECGLLWGENPLSACSNCEGNTYQTENRLDWVILGGETGPGAREMAPNWARIVRNQCKDADVPFFFKKMGDWWEKKHPGHTPPDLLIREIPT
jgi:protein gp37